jgi:hypothetical protein
LKSTNCGIADGIPQFFSYRSFLWQVLQRFRKAMSEPHFAQRLVFLDFTSFVRGR